MTSGIRIYNMLNELPNFRNKDENSNNYKFLNSVAIQLDEVETQSNNMTSEVYISTASNQYLDDLGNLFKLVRQENETDAEFRDRIKSHWNTYSWSGSNDGIKLALSEVLGTSSSTVYITEYEPLKISVQVTITTSQIDMLTTLQSTLNATKAAGVSAFLDYDTVPPAVTGSIIFGTSTLGGTDVF